MPVLIGERIVLAEGGPSAPAARPDTIHFRVNGPWQAADGGSGFLNKRGVVETVGRLMAGGAFGFSGASAGGWPSNHPCPHS